jgi:hypothetical protein
MMIRSLSVLGLLALPCLAQEPVAGTAPAASAVEAENLFYKAFFLQRGERRSADALQLYAKFLEAAPNHRYAGRAAQASIQILTDDGKVEEADKLRAKYSKVLATVDAQPAGAPRGEGAGRGEGRPGAGAPGGGRQARLADLRAQLEKAKADGDAEKVKQLEEQIKTLEAARGPGGQGGQPGQGGRRGFGGPLMSDKKISDMSAEEVEQLTTGTEFMGRMVERMREQGRGEDADKLDANLKKLKDSLAAKKLDEAQKALDEIRKAMPRRGGG